MMLDRLTRFTLVGLALFLGVAAIVGGVSVVPTLPTTLLAGTPFMDYTIPAFALTAVGVGAFATAALLVWRPAWGSLLTIVVGLGMMIFEVVETSVVGLDVWLHALGLSATAGGSLEGFGDLTGIPAPLGIPLPLWLQPIFFVYGAVMVALALRLWAHVPTAWLHRHPTAGGSIVRQPAISPA